MARSGLNVAGAVRYKGDVVEVDDAVADYLCPGGHAERVAPLEGAVAGPPETTSNRATARTGKPQRRT
jgi:hypothetical protein